LLDPQHPALQQLIVIKAECMGEGMLGQEEEGEGEVQQM
jgi:hypothetical protein